MAVLIESVEPRSPAARAGVTAGMTLLSVGGHLIRDVLDYRFYITARALTLGLLSPGGAPLSLRVRKGEYEDLGLGFGSYLMDRQRGCRNKCVFCFIDQLPKGLRESLYFKDDDTRLSFLFGNYVTLTNLEEEDIGRILAMHISPVNISVHTTDPALRVKMMGNPRAGDVLRWLPRLAEGGIRLNAQLVLCPGLNDGPALERTLRDLTALAPMLQSVTAVPVGLTDHRDGLCPLRPFTPDEARDIIAAVDRFGGQTLAEHGRRLCHAADEFYLLAGLALPPADFYGDFEQLENGVGLWSLLKEEFAAALDAAAPRISRESPQSAFSRTVAIATGRAAQPLLERLATDAARCFPHLTVSVIGVDNHFFGRRITVAGLVTGRDLIAQTRGKLPPGCDELLFPAAMLRREGDLFLDGATPDEVAAALALPVRPVPNDGTSLLHAMLGIYHDKAS